MTETDVLQEVKQKLDLEAVKFEARSPKRVPGLGSLERRILEVNRKRVKVVMPGSKTSFPITEIRGTYAPPFHVELVRNDQHRLRIVVDGGEQIGFDGADPTPLRCYSPRDQGPRAAFQQYVAEHSPQYRGVRRPWQCEWKLLVL